MNTDAESKDHFSNPCTELKPGMTSGYVSQELKTSDHTPLQYDKQVVMSYANTPLNPVAKCLPPKVLEFYAPNIGGCTSTRPDPFSQGSEYTSQHIITPVSLGSDPQTNTVSSCHYVNFPQPLVGYSNIYAPPVTSVTWSTKPEIKYPERLSSQTPQDIPLSSRPTCVSTSPAVSNSFQAYSPHDPKFESPLNHSFPSSTPLWGPSSRSTSTPYSSRVKSNPLHRPAQVDPRGEPVDAFIDRLIDGQETVFAESLNSSLTDSGTALLRAQEQQRLPPLELFKFTGKPIEWPKFIERFRDQIHNKTTLTDSDRMSYLFQNLSGEAKKAIESLGVTGHSYSTALKTLKRQFGNPSSVASAYLKNMLDNSCVTPNDRQALRDYYYQVKACTTWCVKMGQSAILLTPEYLSRATMRLPINLRVRWYEHIDGHAERATLLGFEKWLCKRVDTLFNPLEDFICEEWNKKQSCMKPKSNLKLHSLATTTKPPKPSQVQPRMKEVGNIVHVNEQKCVVCSDRHRVAFCPVFKSKALKERKQVVWEHRLCFNCLKANHQSKECPSTNRCLREHCSRPHHTLLHEDRQSDPHTDSSAYSESTGIQSSIPPKESAQPVVPNTSSPLVPSDVSRSINQVSVQPRRKVLLQVLPVQIHSYRGVVDTYAALDAGSDSILIRKDLAHHLQLEGETHQLSLNTVGSDAKIQNLSRVSFSLSSKDHPQLISVQGAWVIDKLSVPSVKVSKEKASEQWNHLLNIDLPELDGSDVKVLIGSDMAHLLIHLEVCQGQRDEPIAVKTPLGWTLFGNVDNGHCDTVNANFLVTDQETQLQKQIERFWEIDSYATKQAPSDSGMSAEDRRALSILESSTVKEEGHYKTALLWKGEPNLPNNRAMAVSCLHSTERKLKKNPELARKYQDVINSYISKGHAKKLTPEESKGMTSKTRYLPHHAVLNPNKPGKVRVVFDAVSKYDRVCLNDKLPTGPDLLNNLVGILMRFRSGKIGIMADVEQMFHQGGVCEEDRDSLRFLWRDLDETRLPDEYQMTVHVFGAVDSPCCANYALQRTALDQSEKFSKDPVHAVLRNFYMDDLLSSKPNSDGATNLAKQLIELLATGGFRLTKWMSNSREILAAIPSSEVAFNTVDLDCNELPQERALGVKWYTEQDFLCLQPVKSGFPDTKRGILSAACSVFDPLGFAAPYVIQAKLIIQELWRRQIDWDEELPDEILQGWQSWKDGLKSSQIIAVPRWYGFHRDECQDVQLHVFCDASEIAYGAVAYFRTISCGSVNVSFIMSKTRLARIKTLTIPRLELQDAVIAVRLKSKILEEIDFEVDDMYLWSDSEIVLHYIRNTHRRFSVYVSHRVAEITSNSDVTKWHHVSGLINVADDCTRWIEMCDLTPECRWINGPKFLMLTEDQWPRSERASEFDDSELEVKASVLTTSATPSVSMVTWERFSSWRKLVRVYAWWMKYKFKLKCKVNKKCPSSERQGKTLCADELKEASLALCQLAQIESFKEDYEDLQANRALPHNSSLLPLQPIFLGGVIRV